MPAKFDLKAKLHSIIQAEVDAALAPYREFFESLAKLHHAPAARPARQVKARRPRQARKPAPIAFEVGQRVLYRQGRGQFEAKVTEIHQERGLVEVERESDGKRVLRPADKLVAAPATEVKAVPAKGAVKVRKIENGKLIERELAPARDVPARRKGGKNAVA